MVSPSHHHLFDLDLPSFGAAPLPALLARKGVFAPPPGDADAHAPAPLAELAVVALLLGGLGAIAWFFWSEYAYLRDKTAAMSEAMINNGRDPRDVEKELKAADLIDYRLDYLFGASEWAEVVFLLGISYLLVVSGAVLLVAADADDYGSISEAVWISWTYAADPGTQADAPAKLITRVVSSVVTVGGLLVFALLIGIVGEFISKKLEGLRTGRSRVFESGHYLMLNWNDKSLAVIRQIATVNEGEGGGKIVVLSQLGKVAMEGKLGRAQAAKEDPLRLRGTEVIFRQGNPLLEADLKRVSADTARSVIALTPTDLDPDEADAGMLRQVLALKALDGDFGKDGRSHVVVELQDVDNKELIRMVAEETAEVIVNHDMIGRLMLQCARTPELAFVLDSMMGFEGSEFYFGAWPELRGRTFKEITCRFDDAIPVGFRSAKGVVTLNPYNEMMYKEGDEIVVLADNEDSYRPNDGDWGLSWRDRGNKEERFMAYDNRPPEKILFCGWRRDMADLIKQLDAYVPIDSELWLFNTIPANMRQERLLDGGNKDPLRLRNLTMRNVVGNCIIRRDLNRIWDVDPLGKYTGAEIELADFDSILILSDETAMKNGEKGSTSSDSRSLASVLIIQDMMEKMYDKRRKLSHDPDSVKRPCIPVSEILSGRTKSLLSVANCKGYVMSNRIISSVVVQVAVERGTNVIFKELLGTRGCNTCIWPVERFVDLGKSPMLAFWEVALIARRKREIALGYKPKEMNYTEAEELIINPPNKSTRRKWSKGDKIITFALEM